MMKILLWIIAVPLIFLALFIVLRFAFCRPNYFVVKTATPMAEKIADYIIENGVPESLDAIPTLPYELKGCNRKEIYWKEHEQIESNQNAETIEIYMSCVFIHRNKILFKDEIYNVNFKYNSSFKMIDIDILNKSENTGIGYELKEIKNKKFQIHFVGDGYVLRHKGFCRSFNQ